MILQGSEGVPLYYYKGREGLSRVEQPAATASGPDAGARRAQALGWHTMRWRDASYLRERAGGVNVFVERKKRGPRPRRHAPP